MTINQHTTIILTASQDKWLTPKNVENITTQSFSKKVLIEKEEDKNDWVEISNDEKENIEKEVKKILGIEEEIIEEDNFEIQNERQ